MLDAGSEQDLLTSNITVTGGSVDLNGVIKGKGGNDIIQSTIDLDVSGGFFSSTTYDVAMAIHGGSGNDDTTFDLIVANYDPLPGDIWSLNIDGGSGDDTLSVSITDGVDGALIVDGGSGNDVISVSGGLGNMLLGGYGFDDLTGGASNDTLDGGGGQDTLNGGDDWLTGGARADEFVFNTGSDEGTDRITDWEVHQDILSFIGLADTGAAGLADDIDAVSTILDDGTDVVLDLDWGTMLIFEGAGTGSVDSIADIMSDPLNQLA